jgi:hypothetical protein
MNTAIILPDKSGFKIGRPTSTATLRTQKIREFMLKRFEKDAVEVYDALYRSAVGIEIEDVDKDGETFYYSKAPDVNAARLLLEHTIGKPKEQIEHTGAMSLFHIIQQLKESHGNSVSDN